MRLIDADALSEKLCETTIFIKDGEVFQRMINNAPTVSAEAAEVVRCKDCRWAEKAILDEYCVECTMYHTSSMRHGYCHHGERREEDDK